MSYRDDQSTMLRVLFCIGVSQTFFDAESAALPELILAIQQAFAGLGDRFGLKVLGTMDDDQLMVGPSPDFPWTAYILADAPDLDAVASVCNIVREAPVGSERLWKYVRMEARVGRRLFFGND
jgi:hypothetical protein